MRITTRQARTMVITALLVILCTGCINPRIQLFRDKSEPLKEYTLEGKGMKKILIIPVEGFISGGEKRAFLRAKVGILEEVTSQLRKARKDKNIKAVVLKVNSPGGSTFASDALYHEFLAYRSETDVKLVTIMMATATSGGYYIALPSDFIMAHPTTVTGSIGVIFIRPQVGELMEKLGIETRVEKSGRNKDMGSPFRSATPEEQQILQTLIDSMGNRFLELVAKHRRVTGDALTTISTARVFLAHQALDLGLIDGTGYVEDALDKARQLAALGEEARVIVYRRQKYSDDNIYNTATLAQEGGKISLAELGFLEAIPALQSGFYYLWLPELDSR